MLDLKCLWLSQCDDTGMLKGLPTFHGFWIFFKPYSPSQHYVSGKKFSILFFWVHFLTFWNTFANKNLLFSTRCLKRHTFFQYQQQYQYQHYITRIISKLISQFWCASAQKEVPSRKHSYAVLKNHTVKFDRTLHITRTVFQIIFPINGV